VRIRGQLRAVIGGTLTVATAAGLLAALAIAAPAQAGTAGSSSARPSAHPGGGLGGSSPRLAAALPLSAAQMRADLRRHDEAQQATSILTGVVRTAAGAPAESVCVTAYGPSGARSAVTKADGRYFITGLRAGEYQLEYRGCGGSGAASYLPEWYGGTVQRSGSQAVVVGGSSLQPVQSLSPVTVHSADSMLGDRQEALLHGSALVASGPVGSPPTPLSPAALAQSMLAAARQGELGSPHLISARLATVPLTTGTASGRFAGVVTSPAGKGLKGICVDAFALDDNGFAGAKTAAGGRYRTNKTAPGQYEMMFFTGCGNNGNWLDQFYKNDYNASGGFTVVTVKAGRTTKIDAVMQPGAEISGTVTGAKGKKLSGVCVVPYQVRGSDKTYGSAVTHDGVYHLGGLPAGAYKLGFWPCRNSLDAYAPILWPRTDSTTAAKSISLRPPHQVGHINEVMQIGGVITGTVTSATTPSTPLAGMCVGTQETNLPRRSLIDPFGGASTNAAGTYRIEGLPSATYKVTASPGCSENANYLPATHRGVTVREGATSSGIDLALSVGNIISGTVTSATTGEPLAGICALVLLSNGEPYEEVASATDGTYSADELPAGQYQVEFGAGCGSTGDYAPQAYNDTSLLTPDTISITGTGQTVSGIDAAMQPGAEISGTVKDAAGQAVEVCVEAVTPGGVGYDLVVSPHGKYQLTDMSPGRYLLSFIADADCGTTEDLVSEWYPNQIPESTAASVSAIAGTVTGINAVLPEAGAFSGENRTASGKFVGDYCMYLTGLSGSAKNLIGDFFLPAEQVYDLTGLPTGKWQVAFVPACYHWSYATQYYKDKPTPAGATAVTVTAGHIHTGINSALVAGGSISGKVTGDGKPAYPVCVFAQNVSAPADSSQATTNGSGDYELKGLNTGSYEVELTPCGNTADTLAGALVPHVVHVTAPRTTTGVNAVLPVQGTITGTVLGGSPATGQAGVCVDAAATNGIATESAITSQTGAYTIKSLPPGTYQVEVGDQACNYVSDLAALWYPDATTQAAAQTVTVASGAATPLSPVTLPSDGSIGGTVTQSGGSALAGVCVAATQTGPVAGLPVYAVTTSSGSYSIIDLPPGTYRVEFSSGCGATGYRTQWWDDKSISATATPVTVTTGTTTSGISAVMAK
jgi:hypothetical protein